MKTILFLLIALPFLAVAQELDVGADLKSLERDVVSAIQNVYKEKGEKMLKRDILPVRLDAVELTPEGDGIAKMRFTSGTEKNPENPDYCEITTELVTTIGKKGHGVRKWAVTDAWCDQYD